MMRSTFNPDLCHLLVCELDLISEGLLEHLEAVGLLEVLLLVYSYVSRALASSSFGPIFT